MTVPSLILRNESAHSPVSASGYYRWRMCPGSVRLSKGIKSESTIYAAEGTVAHFIGANVLQGFIELRALHDKPWDCDGHKGVVTEEMLEAVGVYVDTVLAETVNRGAVLYVEKSLPLPEVHPEAHGTADAIVYRPEIRRLVVIDYKHGAGVEVEVVGNEQAMYYALAALLRMGVAVDEVELVIVQPRYDEDEPVKRWLFKAFDLLEFAADLRRDAAATDDPNAAIVAGDHCRWCPAAATCVERARVNREIAKLEFKPLMAYDPAQLSAALKAIPAMKAWAKAVTEFAYGEARKGQMPPGFKLVAKRAWRKWKDQRVAESLLVLDLGVAKNAIYEEPALKSPAQIEKLLNKADRKELQRVTTKESSGYTLAPQEDARQAVTLDARTEFAGITFDAGDFNE